MGAIAGDAELWQSDGDLAAGGHILRRLFGLGMTWPDLRGHSIIQGVVKVA